MKILWVFLNTGRIFQLFLLFVPLSVTVCLSNISPSPAPQPLEDKYAVYCLGFSDGQQLYELTKSPFSLYSVHRNRPSHSTGV